MAGMVMPPMAEAVATPEPEMAPNSAEARTATTATLPRIQPIMALAMSMSFTVMLRDMMLPAKMKNGIASSEEEFIPANSFCGRTRAGIPAIFSAASVPIPRAM